MGPLPDSGVGWESGPPSPGTQGQEKISQGLLLGSQVSLPTLLLSPTQMNEHTHNLSLSLPSFFLL